VSLTLKITLATLLGVFVVVAGYSWSTVRREVAQFDRDNRDEHLVLGRALAAAVATAWRDGGEQAAMSLIESADAEQQSVSIRWVSLTGAPGESVPPFQLPAWVLSALSDGQTVTVTPPDRPGSRLYTYVPIPLASPLTGAVEISKSLDAQRAFTRATIWQAVLATALIVVLCGAIALAAGSVLVARPINRLVEFSARIARGDFDARLSLPQSDELGTLGAALDRMAAQLSTSVQQVRHADRLGTVGKLAAGVAHELGTPLAVIGGNARMIERGELAGDEARKAAATMAASAGSMSATIRQLLDFARRSTPRLERVDVTALAERTLSMLRSLAERRRVTLALEHAEPIVTIADGGQIEQALINLVINAVQAMPEGGRVTVRVARAHEPTPADLGGDVRDDVVVSVRDEGSGIGEEVLRHVFEPFYTTKPIGEGTGLGLSVSYGLVREHGGWISAESEPGRGSCFAIHLPIAAEAAA
jgi:signal transduction histidine kinase